MSDPDVQVSAYNTPANTPKSHTRLPSSRRRDKSQLSCNLCRRRKYVSCASVKDMHNYFLSRTSPSVLICSQFRLKCNRESPCSTCSKRGLASSCTYTANVRPSSDAGLRQASRPPDSVQDRIQQLESLVVDLMQKTAPKDSFHEPQITPEAVSPTRSPDGPAKATSTENTTDDTSSRFDYGSMKLSNSGASYVNSAHWAAVLDRIAELKDHFEKEEETHVARRLSDPPYPDLTGPQLLYGCLQYATKEEILASVPTRSVVDRLVSRYFNSFDMSPGQCRASK